MAEIIILVCIPTTENKYHNCCICKATSIVDDSDMNCSHCCHLAHGMGEFVPPPLDSARSFYLRRSDHLRHFWPLTSTWTNEDPSQDTPLNDHRPTRWLLHTCILQVYFALAYLCIYCAFCSLCSSMCHALVLLLHSP